MSVLLTHRASEAGCSALHFPLPGVTCEFFLGMGLLCLAQALTIWGPLNDVGGRWEMNQAPGSSYLWLHCQGGCSACR